MQQDVDIACGIGPSTMKPWAVGSLIVGLTTLTPPMEQEVGVPKGIDNPPREVGAPRIISLSTSSTRLLKGSEVGPETFIIRVSRPWPGHVQISMEVRGSY